jgi:Protein of unknown function (DUF2569)
MMPKSSGGIRVAVFCQQCASQMDDDAVVCVQCGSATVRTGEQGESTEVRMLEPSEARISEPAGGPGPSAPHFAIETDLSGIGGWLILTVIGLAVAPFLSIRALYTDLAILFGARFQAGLSSHPLLAGLVLFESATNSIFLVTQIVLNLMLYRRKRAFPAWMITYLAANVILSLFDHLWTIHYEHSSGWMSVARSFVAAAIWIPYFLRSRRVKLTFVQ